MPRTRETDPRCSNRPDVASEAAIVVRSLGLRLPSGHRIPAHSHPWPQLVYATRGVMSVETEVGVWVVPHQRAVWIPAGFEHRIEMNGAVHMRTVYLAPRLAAELSTDCSVVHVSPLLRELVLQTMRQGMLREGVPSEEHLAAVLADQIRETGDAPLSLDFPQDPRARAVAERVERELASSNFPAGRTLAELAAGSGASVRTIERLFVQETGLTFRRWSQHLRVLRALQRLAAGASVTAAGLAVGYESTSAFIAMFKRTLGTTPGEYFSSVSSVERAEPGPDSGDLPQERVLR